MGKPKPADAETTWKSEATGREVPGQPSAVPANVYLQPHETPPPQPEPPAEPGPIPNPQNP